MLEGWIMARKDPLTARELKYLLTESSEARESTKIPINSRNCE